MVFEKKLIPKDYPKGDWLIHLTNSSLEDVCRIETGWFTSRSN
jgi:hypothetical protein